jgi:hypothetical protein
VRKVNINMKTNLNTVRKEIISDLNTVRKGIIADVQKLLSENNGNK